MMHGQPIDSIISFFEFMGKLIAIMCGTFLNWLTIAHESLLLQVDHHALQVFGHIV